MENAYMTRSIFLILCVVLKLTSCIQSHDKSELHVLIYKAVRSMESIKSTTNSSSNSGLLPVWAGVAVRDQLIGSAASGAIGSIIDGASDALDSIGLGFVGDAFNFLGFGDPEPSTQDVMDHMDTKLKELNEEITATITAEIGELEWKMAQGFESMNGRFDQIDKSLLGIAKDIAAMEENMNNQFKQIGAQLLGSTNQLLDALDSVSSQISREIKTVNDGLDRITVQLNAAVAQLVTNICGGSISYINSKFDEYEKHITAIVRAIRARSIEDYHEEVVSYDKALTWGETDLMTEVGKALDCYGGEDAVGSDAFFEIYATEVKDMDVDPVEKLRLLAATLIYFYQVYEKADILLFHIVYKNHLKSLIDTDNRVISKWSPAKKKGKAYTHAMETVIWAKGDQRRFDLADEFWKAIPFVWEGISCSVDYKFYAAGALQSHFRHQCKTRRVFPQCPQLCPHYSAGSDCTKLRTAVQTYELLKNNWPYSWTAGASDVRAPFGYVINNIRYEQRCRASYSCQHSNTVIGLPDGVWYTKSNNIGTCYPPRNNTGSPGDSPFGPR